MDSNMGSIYCPRTLVCWLATRAYTNDPRKLNLDGDSYSQCTGTSELLEYRFVSWLSDEVKEWVVDPVITKSLQLTEGASRWWNSRSGGDIKHMTHSISLCNAALDQDGKDLWGRIFRGADQHLSQLQSLYPEKSNQTTAIKGPREALQKAFDPSVTLQTCSEALEAKKIKFRDEEWSARKVEMLSLIREEMAERRDEPELLVALAKAVEYLVRPNWAARHKDCDYNPVALCWVLAAQDLCPEPTSKQHYEAKGQMTRLGFYEHPGWKAVYLRYPSPVTDLYNPGNQGEHRQFEVCESLKVAAGYLNDMGCPSLWPLTAHVQQSITKLIGHYKGQSAQGALETALGYIKDLKPARLLEAEADHGKAQEIQQERQQEEQQRLQQEQERLRQEQARRAEQQRKQFKRSNGAGKKNKGSQPDLQDLELTDVPDDEQQKANRAPDEQHSLEAIKQEMYQLRQDLKRQALRDLPRPHWQGLEAKLEKPLFQAFDSIYTPRLELICIGLYDLMMCSKEQQVDRDAAYQAMTHLTDHLLLSTATLVGHVRQNPNYLK